MAKQNNNIQYELSVAILRMFYNKGLITRSELEEIDMKNKVSFCAK